MKRALVSIAKLAFNLQYKRAKRKHGRENLVVFLSRRTDTPSYDFEALAREYEDCGWETVMHLKKVTRRTLAPYAKHVFEELRLLARCKVAVLDRYDPVISLLNLDCETNKQAHGSRNTSFPVQPLVLQLWHAFGAYKKFGFQSTDTTEGHTSEFSDVFNIHRNYSWIICSGEGCRAAFAEAFAYPIERVVALNRPEYDELVEIRNEQEQAKGSHINRRLKVLMAPTLRINKSSAHPFRELYKKREAIEGAVDAEIVWSFHPLEEKLPAPGNVSQALVDCDIVVTDYSSIAYEAFALGKMTLFYIPDIESYRTSPGLNADPLCLSPGICFCNESELVDELNELVESPDAYPHDQLAAFAASAFDEPTDGKTATARIVDFTLSNLENRL